MGTTMRTGRTRQNGESLSFGTPSAMRANSGFSVIWSRRSRRPGHVVTSQEARHLMGSGLPGGRSTGLQARTVEKTRAPMPSS